MPLFKFQSPHQHRPLTHLVFLIRKTAACKQSKITAEIAHGVMCSKMMNTPRVGDARHPLTSFISIGYGNFRPQHKIDFAFRKGCAKNLKTVSLSLSDSSRSFLFALPFLSGSPCLDESRLEITLNTSDTLNTSSNLMKAVDSWDHSVLLPLGPLRVLARIHPGWPLNMIGTIGLE